MQTDNPNEVVDYDLNDYQLPEMDENVDNGLND